MFKRTCQVCIEKDARIADLQAEVAYLREFNSPARLTVQIPEVNSELHKVLEQRHIEAPEEEVTEAELVESEASRILSGNY